MMLEPSETDVRYRCEQCSHEAVWPFQLDHHIQTSHRTNVHTAGLFSIAADLELYPCFYCDFETCHKVGQYEHCIRMHGSNGDIHDEEVEMSYSCNKCKYKGHASLSVLKHLCKAIRNDPLADVGAVAPIDFENDVKPQNLIFIDSSGSLDYEQLLYKNKDGSIMESQLTKHVASLTRATYDEAKRFSCSKCTYRSKQKGNLKRHMLTHAKCTEGVQDGEKHIKQNDNEIKRFHCDKCSYQTKWKKGLTAHMLVHVPPEQIIWFYCPNCSYRSKRNKSLRLHMLLHNETDRMDCTKCSFRTSNKKILKQHMLIHETNPLFNCTKCSYGSKRKGDLAVHMRTHAAADEIKWFHCTKCAHRAKSKGHLNRHMLTHAEIKLFSCNKCPYQGESRSEIAKHSRTHVEVKVESSSYTLIDGIKWFGCAQCLYKTKFKKAVKVHMLTHASADEIDWFNCTECCYRAKRKGCLRRHMLVHAKTRY